MKAVICGFAMVVLGAFLHDLTWHRMPDGSSYSDLGTTAFVLVFCGSLVAAAGGIFLMEKAARS